MPYVRCPHCGVRGYRAVPWSSAADCSNCGTAIEVQRHGHSQETAPVHSEGQPSRVPVEPRDRLSCDEPQQQRAS